MLSGSRSKGFALLDPKVPDSWPELIKVTEVAALIRVSPVTVRSMILRGELEGSKVGRAWRVRKASLCALLGHEDGGRDAD